jgi:hypothetical protein
MLTPALSELAEADPIADGAGDGVGDVAKPINPSLVLAHPVCGPSVGETWDLDAPGHRASVSPEVVDFCALRPAEFADATHCKAADCIANRQKGLADG